MSNIIRIAIDGPGGAGKSTIAKLIARKMNIDYIDTGAMYRAMAYKAINENVKMEEGPDLTAMLDNTDMDFADGKIFLDGKDVSGLIRTPEISAGASMISKLPSVRKKLVDLQRKMAQSKSVIMDGRDIGTNVLKDAEYKFYITAAPEERAKRRYEEMKAKGEEADYDQILKDINERDYNDMHRKLNPLCKAEDAVEVDTTSMTIDEVVNFVCSKIED